ncbi:MAG: 23S rRNA (uracil(1939)-C(5))-methyltransferase RlmD [Dinghuibacter sp.]|nr:23S rRNA (uracil(1939)-C(5))-methyltransferase RlmD [Dinghuibacter sp.]
MAKKKRKFVLENILVSDYAAGGKSLSRTEEGKVIFIEGAVPGDEVDVLVMKNKADWAEARVLRTNSFSPMRTEPFCGHFGVCGGCKWQMLPYEKQLEYKQREVLENLKRIGKIALPEIQPILASASDRFYRNKLEFTFSNRRYLMPEELETGVSGETPVLGYHVPGFFDKVIDITTCYLMPEPVNALRNAVREFALQQGYSFYDIRNHTGWLRNMVVRMNNDGELMVNMIFGHDSADKTPLLNHIQQLFPQVVTLLYTINPKFNDSIHDLEPQLWHGNGYITIQLGEYRFKTGPKSFFQTNTGQAERLYEVVRKYAATEKKGVVYDLYCGTGSIGIFCSSIAEKIIGVELVAAAINDARENAALNGLNNAQFFAGDVAEICTPAFFEQHGRPDVVITDPPRAGMHPKLLNQILAMEAPVVVYVSCNSATQARDLNVLNEKYRVTDIQPVDMFPHTHHIENVVRLVLKGDE